LFAIYGAYAPYVPEDFMEDITLKAQANAKRTRAEFEEGLKGSNLIHDWEYQTIASLDGDNKVIGLARCKDLIICPAGTKDIVDPVEFMEVALLESGRPILVVPRGFAEAQFGGSVAIAWNGSREATRAVFDAMPFLRAASRVILITCYDADHLRNDSNALNAQLTDTLNRHEIKAESILHYTTTKDVAHSLKTMLIEERVTLIVMGGYSRAPWREMLFGGVSHSILQDVSIPTLISH
jgi:nucleotide-binding universal stress UspA family protein